MEGENEQPINQLDESVKLAKELIKQKDLGKYHQNVAKEIVNNYKNARKNYRRKAKELNGYSKNVSKSQISSFITKLKKIKSPAALKLLLSLYTGRNLIENPKSILLKCSNKPNFKFEVFQKDYDIGNEISDKIQSTSNYLILQLPGWFNQFDEVDFFQAVSKKECSSLLSALNSNSTNKLSFENISGYLTFWLTNQGVDTSDIAIINGKSIWMVSGVNYYRTTNQELQQKYNQYVCHLESVCEEDYIFNDIDSQYLIGSQLVMDDKHLSDQLKKIRYEIYEFKFTDFESIQKHHNLITIYTLFILNLSTGHRPVNDLYTSLSSFNLMLKTVHISDKSIENTLVSRVAVLPNTAVRQFEYYLNYLETYLCSFEFVNIKTTEKIKKMLENKTSLFQFFNGVQLQTILRGDFANESKKIFDIPENWHRHYMRTKLSAEGVKGELIDMFMGHEGKGGYGLAIDSFQSLSDLKSVAYSIDQIFTKLEIKEL